MSDSLIRASDASPVDAGDTYLPVNFAKNSPDDFLSTIDLWPVSDGWSGKFASLRTFLNDNLLASRPELTVTLTRPIADEVIEALKALV